MEDKKLPRFIIDLANYLIAIKNLSNIYIENMAVTIEQFLDFINIYKFNDKYESISQMSINDLRVLTNSDIYSFMFFLAENHYKTSSRITKTEHLRTFFNYLFKIKQEIFKQPFKQIKREKKKYLQLPNYLSLEESKNLLKQYANTTDEAGIRNNAMLHLFLNCGLRVSEAKNLDISDFNLVADTFVIKGKGNKERTGYLNKSTKEALLKYLEIRKDMKTKSSKDRDALFLVAGGTRITVRRIQKIVDKALIKAGIDNNEYSVHSLRHTCATLLYRAGIDIKIIKELLGHVKIDTTEIYTHLYNKQVMDAMLDHPLAKFKMANALAFCA